MSSTGGGGMSEVHLNEKKTTENVFGKRPKLCFCCLLSTGGGNSAGGGTSGEAWTGGGS